MLAEEMIIIADEKQGCFIERWGTSTCNPVTVILSPRNLPSRPFFRNFFGSGGRLRRAVRRGFVGFVGRCGAASSASSGGAVRLRRLRRAVRCGAASSASSGGAAGRAGGGARFASLKFFSARAGGRKIFGRKFSSEKNWSENFGRAVSSLVFRNQN